MIGLAKIGVLAAHFGTQRCQLGPDEGSGERDEAAQSPHAENQEGGRNLAGNDVRINEDA